MEEKVLSEEQLDELAREARNAYNREWSARNPEKRAAINKRYWAKRALRMKAEENAKKVKEN